MCANVSCCIVGRYARFVSFVHCFWPKIDVKLYSFCQNSA